MAFEFEGRVIEWRGPAPFYFVTIPKEESDDIKDLAKGIEYWGQVPVTVRIGGTEFSTALFPKDGRYLLPLKNSVRESARIGLDQIVAVDAPFCAHGRREIWTFASALGTPESVNPVSRDSHQTLRIENVETLAPVQLDADEPGVLEHPKVPGRRRPRAFKA